MFLSTIGTRLVHAGSTVVLMRLLGPEQFGIIGFAVIFKEMVLLFSSWGVQDAVIQKRGDQNLIASGLALSILRSILFSVVLLIGAPFAADFFSTPEVTIVIRVSALLILLGPIRFTANLKMTMDLRFTALAIISFVGACANAAVAVIAAFAGFGFMAIVLGNVAGSIAGLIGALIAQPSIIDPRMASTDGIREIVGFGYHLTISGIVAWIYLNVDDLIVGKLLGRTVLGLYTKAYWIATLPSETIGRILYTVTFPAYVRVKDDLNSLRKMFLEVYTMNVLISLPAIVGILVLSDKIVPLVFGDEWIPMITILELTCVVGLLRAVYGQANSIFKAVGRPDYYWKPALVQALIVLTLGLWATTVWGVYGMLGSLVVAMSWGFVSYGYLAFRKVLDVRLRSYLRILTPLLVSTFLMTVFASFIETYVTSLLSLGIVVAVSAGLYFIMVYLLGGQDVVIRGYTIAKRIIGLDKR